MWQNHQFMLSRCKIVVAGVAPGGLSIAEIQRDLRTGQRTATDVAKEYVDRAIKYNDSISSFIMIDAEGALENVGECLLGFWNSSMQMTWYETTIVMALCLYLYIARWSGVSLVIQ